MDLNRCISYWTTRHEELISPELWPAIGEWVFGCDICQEVCPWNWKAEKAGWFWEGFRAGQDLAHPDLADFLTLSEPDFARKYASSAFVRAGRTRLARNALIVLSNTGDHGSLMELAARDVSPLVRATAAEALVRSGSSRAAETLLTDPSLLVRRETRLALERVDP